MKILHIAQDQKFIDMGIASFDRVSPGCNDVIIIKRKSKLQHVRLKPIEEHHVIFQILKKSNIDFSKYTFVVLHSLSKDLILFFLSNRALFKMPLVWIGWGFDYYRYATNDANFNLYEEKTKNLLKGFGLRLLKYRLSHYIKNNILFNYILNVAANNIMINVHIFCPVINPECELVHKWLPGLNAKCMQWNYGTIEKDYVFEKNLEVVDEGNIWIGNSATPENNHIDAFNIIKYIKYKPKKIIVPLSYGNKTYAKIVSAEGNQIFGDKYLPLYQYVELEEYKKLLSTSTYFVMPHRRQQALANIVIAMYMGGRIFLNRSNPIYKYFKSQGAIIFSMEQLREEIGHGKLNKKELENNRKVLMGQWSQLAIDNKTKKIIDSMSECS